MAATAAAMGTTTMARSEAAASSPPRSRASAGAEVAALTSAMAAGNGPAVEAFYRRYFDRLYGEARRSTRRDEAFCLDVVQESVLRILRTIRPVSTEARLVAWINLVVRTTAYDLLRGERRRQRRELAVSPAPDVDRGDGEQLEWLARQLAALDPELLRLVEMRYERRWTLTRIAAAVGLSLGAVDRRLRKALGELRETARADWPEDVHDA